MSKPSLVLRLGFVQSEERLNTPFLFAKYGGKSRFYSCNQNFNYVRYVGRGSKEKFDYIAYSGDGEKSVGVFSKHGLLNAKEQAELKERLRKTKSVIWHGVIAFSQGFGNTYMNDTDDALRLLNAEFPKFFKSAGLNPDNVSWYAGLHENTDKRHIHFSFFENEPSRYTKRGGKVKHFSEGHIPGPVLDRFKISVEQRLTDITSELKIARKNLTDLSKEVLFSGKNRRKNLLEIQEYLTGLIPLLPTTGRLSYDSENMSNLKPVIRRIVDLLVKSEPKVYGAFVELCDALQRKDNKTRAMLISQKVDEKYWDSYMTAGKVLDDVYRRLGNFVIDAARSFKDGKKQAGRLVKKRIRKQTTAAVLTYCLTLGASIENEAMDAFAEYMRRLKKAEEEIGTEEYGRGENEMD